MAEERRVAVMPVELAIQRELAYRRKLEALGLQPQGGSWKDLTPLQVPSSSASPSPKPSPSPSLQGIKQKTTSSSLQCLPPQHQQPVYGSHFPKKKTDNLLCKICQVLCSSRFNLKQHLEGQKRKAKLLELKLGRKHDEEKANQRQWCELCEIPCPDECAFEQHLEGQKHKAKLQALELGRGNSEEKANQRRWCKICGIWCMDEKLYTLHLEGKKHTLQLRAIEEKKMAERGSGLNSNAQEEKSGRT